MTGTVRLQAVRAAIGDRGAIDIKITFGPDVAKLDAQRVLEGVAAA